MISMSLLFDDLKEELEEAIAYEKGTGPACRLLHILASGEDVEYIVAK